MHKFLVFEVIIPRFNFCEFKKYNNSRAEGYNFGYLF